MTEIDLLKLFFDLYNAQTEDDVDKIIAENFEASKDDNWHPLGGD